MRALPASLLLALAACPFALRAQSPYSGPWERLPDAEGGYVVQASDGAWFFSSDADYRRLARSADGVAFAPVPVPLDAGVYVTLVEPGLLLAAFGYDPLDGPASEGGPTNGHLGIGVSRDGGGTWALSEPVPELFEDELLLFFESDRTTGQLYFFTSLAAYRSDDGGSTWSPITQDLPPPTPGPAVSYIPYDAVIDGGVGLLASTVGTYRTEDAGVTWSNYSEGISAISPIPFVWTVELAADGTAYVGAATLGFYAGAWRRASGGDAWGRLDLPAPDGPYDAVLAVSDLLAAEGQLFLTGDAMSSYRHGIVYRSLDGGGSWEPLSGGLPTNAGAFASGLWRVGDTLFATVIGEGPDGVVRTAVYRRPLGESVGAGPPPDADQEALRVFPNPARTHVDVAAPRPGAERSSAVEVVDVLGRVVARLEGAQRERIDVGAWPPGRYIARSGGQTVAFTVVR